MTGATLPRKRSARRHALWLALSLDLVAVSVARAQQQRLGPYEELRADAVIGAPNAVHAGGGVQIPLGYYARLGVDVAGGVARANDASLGSARGDAIVRFLLDPFREVGWALSGGAGVTVRYDDRYGWRPFLAVVLDLEGRRAGPLTPAFQLGLGGGARLGMVWRASTRAYR